MPKIPKTLSNENRMELVHIYKKRVLRCLNDARDLFESKPYFSVRASYEAVYHFTVALFICEGIHIPKTHRGMNSELYSNFVDKGLFPRDIAAHFGQLENDRNTDQYDPEQETTTEIARQNLKKAEAFCEAMQKLVGNLTVLEA